MKVKPKFEFEELTFDNGLWLGYKQVDSPDVVLRVDVDQGRVYEESSKAGITHLLEHMLFKGTPTKSSVEIAKEFEKLSGRTTRAVADYEKMVFELRAPEYNMEKVVDLFFEIFANIQFSEDGLEKEKVIFGSEISEDYGTPLSNFENEVRRKIYPGHPYGELDSGTKETIDNISVQDLVKLKENRFVGSNTKISVAGGFSPKLIKKIEQTFGRLEKGKPAICPYEVLPINPEEMYDSFEAQPYISLSVISQGPGTKDKESVAMDIIGTYLGRGRTSRLFRVFREENQICYSFGIDVESKLLRSHQVIYARNFDPSKHNYVLQTMKGEMDRSCSIRNNKGWLVFNLS